MLQSLSPVAGKYDNVIDRESAEELLSAKAGEAAAAAAEAKADAEADKAAAAKAKDAADLDKARDKAVANYKKNKGVSMSPSKPAKK